MHHEYLCLRAYDKGSPLEGTLSNPKGIDKQTCYCRAIITAVYFNILADVLSGLLESEVRSRLRR